MLEEINKYDLVITTKAIKTEILKKATQRHQLIKGKIMTKEEYIKSVLPQTDEEGLYFLMKNYNMSYLIAKEYLKNIHIKNEPFTNYYQALVENKLITEKEVMHNRALIIETKLDELYKNKIKEINYYKKEEKKYQPKVYEYEDIEDEVAGAVTKIISDLKQVDINDMYLVIPNEEYIDKVDRIFSLYNIPVVKKEEAIYSTLEAQKILKELKKTKNIKKSLEKSNNNDVTNRIIEILNKYSFIKDIDNKYIDIIENELKIKQKKSKKHKNIIKVISPEEIESKNKYYYILGFNQNLIPKIYDEEGLVNDELKKENKLFTSIEKTSFEKEKIKNIITTYPNIYLSYKLKDNQNKYYPSSLIEDLNIKVVNEELSLNYSNNYNQLLLGKLLDNYSNYGEKNENLSILYRTYPSIEYKTYSNKFKGLKEKQAMNYLDNKLKLSYSSLNNFYNCSFKYYIENILRLNENENTFQITIGNMFHHILEKIYEKDYDFDTLFTNFVKNIPLTSKETFYLNKLRNILKEDIKVIKMQDSKTLFKDKETEKKITLKIDKNENITFTGIIDKISYYGNNLIVTDYKTGSVNTKLENIDSGLNLQLPAYVYLIKEGIKDKKIVGFYFQKLLNNQKMDDDEKPASDLKLEGYTINKENIIEKIDQTYENSEIIKGMKKSKNGFYSYTKLISEEEIDKISDLVNEKIHEAIKSVESGKFDINPKKINKETSCKYCKYKDLCYREDEDIIELKIKPLKEIVGDSNA